MEAALFSRIGENFRPAWRFWELWRSKMRFDQNVLRMTWKERFGQFSWKTHCFPDLKRISGKCDDFKNLDAQKCALFFLFWRNAHDLKSALFSRFEENLRPVSGFWKLWRYKMRFGQNLLRMTWKERFEQFSWRAHCFQVLARISGQCDDFENLTLKNAIWPKRAAHDLKRAFCTIFMEGALFSRFGENFRPAWRFWELGRSKMRFGQNVLCVTWKERFVPFSWKTHCFSPLKRIWGQFHDFKNFGAQKSDLAKTCCAWPEKRVLYNFLRKRTVFLFWREFQASFTILKTLTLKNAIWPKPTAHDLKRAFCTIFMKSALFFRFEENLRPVSRLWEFWRWKMRFGQNVLRMTWKERFVQFSRKAHGFPVLARFSGQCDDFENLTLKNAIWPKRAAHDLKLAFCTIFMESAQFSSFVENFRPVWRFWKFDAQKCDLAKTCSAWPERSVLYNFHGKRTVFQFWREFQASVMILKIGRSEMRFGQNVLRMTWNVRFVQFSWKAHCFPDLKRISGQCEDFKNFDAQKCDLAKTCRAWPERSVLYNFHGKCTVFPFWREFQAKVTTLRTLTLKNAIWPESAAHDLRRAFCTIFMEGALFSRFGENFRPAWRFWELWRSKMRFDQNVLRMTWKERFGQFSWKTHCFPDLKRISGKCDDFKNVDAQKCALFFLFWRNAHDLKSALFSRFEENLRPVSGYWKLWRYKMRFGQNVLRMTWKERLVQFSWKAHCSPPHGL